MRGGGGDLSILEGFFVDEGGDIAVSSGQELADAPGRLWTLLAAGVSRLRTAAVEASMGARAQTVDGKAIAELVRQINVAEEELVETAAGNSNGYRKAAAGYNANCYFSATPTGGGGGAHGRVALSRDWIAKTAAR